MNRALAPLAASLVAGLVSVPSARADDGWQVRGQLGVGAIAANTVMPLPLAPAASLVAERGPFGFEVGVHANPATYCDYQGEESDCGLLLTAEAGPRLRLESGPWSVYLAVKAQLLWMTRPGMKTPAVAPRLGMTYQAHRVGLFAEVGPTYVLGDPDEYLIGIEKQRALPAADLGLRF